MDANCDPRSRSDCCLNSHWRVREANSKDCDRNGGGVGARVNYAPSPEQTTSQRQRDKICSWRTLRRTPQCGRLSLTKPSKENSQWPAEHVTVPKPSPAPSAMEAAKSAARNVTRAAETERRFARRAKGLANRETARGLLNRRLRGVGLRATTKRASGDISKRLRD